MWQFSVNSDMRALFPEIIAAIRADQQKKAGLTDSYATAGSSFFHSELDLCHRDTEWSRRLREYLEHLTYRCLSGLAPADKYPPLEIWCWVIILDKNDRSRMHAHPRADLSGVIWMEVPEGLENDEGLFRFQDCRPAAAYAGLFANDGMTIKPQSGEGILFPSFMEHEVFPHRQEGSRISLSFDVRLDIPAPWQLSQTHE